MLKLLRFLPPQKRSGTLYGICFNHPEPLSLKEHGKEGGKIICALYKKEAEIYRF